MGGDWQGPALVVAVGLAAWLYLLARYGREPRVPGRQERVLSPPQHWHPNLVRYLVSWGDGMSPTLAVLDLVRRGVLQVVVEGEYEVGRRAPHDPEGYSLVLASRTDEPLSNSDQYLLDTILFYRAEGERANLEEIRQRARADRQDAENRLGAWHRLARAECTGLRLVEPPSPHLRYGGLALGVALVGYGCAGLATSDVAFLPLVGGIAIGLGSLVIKKHTSEGARALRQWQEFGQYLSRFAEWKYPPPEMSACERDMNDAEALAVDAAAERQFLDLFGDQPGTGLSFLNLRFANGLGLDSLRTALAIRRGFTHALGAVWEMHATPARSGS